MSTEHTEHAQAHLPDGRRVTFVHRDVMRRRRLNAPPYRTPVGLPQIPLPIDWGGDLPFPMLGNNKYGDCMYAAACHADQTFTGTWTAESTWDEAAVVRAYLALAGGDRGLDEETLVAGWRAGLAGNADATIDDVLDIDLTDTPLLRSAVYLFGGVVFMLSTPNAWIATNDGDLWDVPATSNPRNGHGTWINGVDADGNGIVRTWGGYRLVTPAGLLRCDPSGFVVWSRRWYDPTTGFAPNGLHRSQLSQLWQEAGGRPPPPRSYPSPFPVA